jgi:hypothetical protein
MSISAIYAGWETYGAGVEVLLDIETKERQVSADVNFVIFVVFLISGMHSSRASSDWAAMRRSSTKRAIVTRPVSKTSAG